MKLKGCLYHPGMIRDECGTGVVAGHTTAQFTIQSHLSAKKWSPGYRQLLPLSLSMVLSQHLSEDPPPSIYLVLADRGLKYSLRHSSRSLALDYLLEALCTGSPRQGGMEREPK